LKVENAKWNPPAGKGHRPSRSVIALRSLAVGDVKRLSHHDVSCKSIKGHLNCSLTQEIRRLRRRSNWEIQYYHEKPWVLVIRRDG